METKENNIQKEMPKKKWRYLLMDYFTDIIQTEENLDSLRQSLAQQDNFSIQNIFNNLDNDQKGYISLGDLIKFLSSHSIEVEEKYLRQIIHFYDKNNDFVLNLEEFTPLISNNEINENKNEENNNKNNQQLEENIVSIFCDILNQEIELCKKCEENSKKCLESRHFTAYEAFVEITEDDGYMTEENLIKFFGENGVKVDEKNIKRIIFRLDKDNDGKVSFVEFNDIFHPPCYNVNQKYNEYKYKLDDLNNNNININKSYEPVKTSQLKNINRDNYIPRNGKTIDNNKYLDFKYGFSQNPRLKYTSSVLNYNYSKGPDYDIDKYKLNKEYNSLKNSRDKEVSDNLNLDRCPLNHVFIHCHCCNCCCHLCCDSNLY